MGPKEFKMAKEAYRPNIPTIIVTEPDINDYQDKKNTLNKKAEKRKSE